MSNKEIERLTEKQLLIKLETRLQLFKENEAAIRIQAQARKMICRMLFHSLQESRHKAASRI